MRTIDVCDRDGQIITLMGVLLALSVFIMASIPLELSDIDVVVSSERSMSLLPEFIHVKEIFGVAFNYNLADISVNQSTNESVYYGNIGNFTRAFNQTRESFYLLELQHDIVFNVALNNYMYAYLSTEGHVYHVYVTLSLDDGTTCLTEDVLYSIICKPYIPGQREE